MTRNVLIQHSSTGIKRTNTKLKKIDLATVVLKQPQMKSCKWGKKPSMPDSLTNRGVLPRCYATKLL